MFAVKC